MKGKNNKSYKAADKSSLIPMPQYSSYIFPAITFFTSLQCPSQESLRQKKYSITVLEEQTTKQVQQIVSYINNNLCFLKDSTYEKISSPHQHALDILQNCLNRGKGTPHTLQYLEAFLKLGDGPILEDIKEIINSIIAEQKESNLMILHLQVELAEFMRKALQYIVIGKNFKLSANELQKYQKYWQVYKKCYQNLGNILTNSGEKYNFKKQDEINPKDINDLIPYINLERIKIMNNLVKIENNEKFAEEYLMKLPQKRLKKLLTLLKKAETLNGYDKIKLMLNHWQLPEKIKSAMYVFHLKKREPNYQNNFVLSLIKNYNSQSQLTKLINQSYLIQIIETLSCQQKYLKRQIFEIFVRQYQCSLLIRTALFQISRLVMEEQKDNSLMIHEVMGFLKLKVQLWFKEITQILKIKQIKQRNVRPSKSYQSREEIIENPLFQLRQPRINQERISKRLTQIFQEKHTPLIFQQLKNLNADQNICFELLGLYKQKYQLKVEGKSFSSEQIKYFQKIVNAKAILSYYFNSEPQIMNQIAFDRKNTSYYLGEKLVYKNCQFQNPTLNKFIHFDEAKDESKYYQFNIKRYKINLDKWHQIQKHPKEEKQQLQKKLYERLKNLESSSDKGIKKLFPIEKIHLSENQLTLIIKQYYVQPEERAKTIQQCIKKVFLNIKSYINLAQKFQFLKNWYLLFTTQTFEIRNLEKEKLVERGKKQKFVFHAHCDQPLLISLLLNHNNLLVGKHPSFPFIDFLLLLQKIKNAQPNILALEGYQKEQFGHMIYNSFAIEMESSNYKSMENLDQKISGKFLDCPFFWDENKKILQVLNFKQKIISEVEKEIKRKKRNQNNRVLLKKKQQIDNFKPKYLNLQKNRIKEGEEYPQEQYQKQEEKQIRYYAANQYHKSTQIFSLQTSIIQAYAQELNISNKSLGEKGYDWHSSKDIIKKLLLRLDKNYQFKNRFTDHIRSLRNILAHTFADSCEKDNLYSIQEAYPKLFVFIFKYRSYVSKPYVHKSLESIQEIIMQTLNKFVTSNSVQQNKLIINQMMKLDLSYPSFVAKFKQFKKIYSSVNQKPYLCKVCSQINSILKKYPCASIWEFLHRIYHQDIQLIFAFHNSTHKCLWIETKVMQQKAESLMPCVNQIDKKNKNWLKQMMNQTDYVPKSFLFQLLHYFPNLIDHIRYHRYQWDPKSGLDCYTNSKQIQQRIEQRKLMRSMSWSKWSKFRKWS